MIIMTVLNLQINLEMQNMETSNHSKKRELTKKLYNQDKN